MKKKTSVILILFITCCTCRGTAQTLDVDILKSINPQNPNSGYWKVTSSSAYWLPAGVAAGMLAYGFMWKDQPTQRNVTELLIGIGVSTAVSEGLKFAVNRTRPADQYPGVIFDPTHTHGKSFPSGHTTLAFATATSLALEYRKWYIVVPAYLWAGSVGYSRMYLGKHYPSDVLGGMAVGVGSSLLSHWLNKKIFNKHR